jgi:List-Bact-rpt repeat protein
MRVFRFGDVVCVAMLGLLLVSLGCAHDQELESIEVQPGEETFGASNIPVPTNAGLAVQLRALGHYIHPPVTKDITNQVAWVSSQTQMVTVNSGGLLTAVGGACGSTLVSATLTTNHSVGGLSSSGAVVTGTMTANVVCFSGSTGNNALLTILITPSGFGTVTVSPSNIVCSSNCTLPFAVGSGPIVLTAAPNSGHSFVAWTGCLGSSGLQCTINSLTAELTVTATFK